MTMRISQREIVASLFFWLSFVWCMSRIFFSVVIENRNYHEHMLQMLTVYTLCTHRHKLSIVSCYFFFIFVLSLHFNRNEYTNTPFNYGIYVIKMIGKNQTKTKKQIANTIFNTKTWTICHRIDWLCTRI